MRFGKLFQFETVAACSTALMLAAALVPISVSAQSSPRTFTVDARLFNPANPQDPLADNSLVVKIQILNPGKTCVLYEETQTISTAVDGRFNLQVGSATGSVKRTGLDPNNAMTAIYQNAARITATNPGCATGYLPTSGDLRYMRITLTPSSTGVAETLTPDTVLDSVPSAMVAESLQGLDRSQVLQIGTPATLSQANVASVFSAANFPKLTSLLNGSSTDYVQSSTTNGANLPALNTAPPAPVAGQIWFDSTNNSVKYYDGSSTRMIGYSGSSITSPLTNGKFWVGNAGNNPSEVNAGGDITMTNTGAVTLVKIRGTTLSSTAPSAEGQVLRYTTVGSQFTPGFLSLQDIRSTVTPTNPIFPAASCSNDKSLSWSSLTDSFTCQSIGIADSQITYAARAANLIFAGPTTGSASPTFRALAMSDLPAGAATQWTLASGSLTYSGNSVGIGTAAPSTGAALEVQATGAQSSVLFPRADTSSRPTSPVNGMFRYNTTENSFEGYANGRWMFIGPSGSSGYIDDLLDASTYGGSNSVFLGRNGGNNNAGDGNTATGWNAMATVTSGNLNTAAGNLALNANATGNNNTAIGYKSGIDVTGSSNTLVGAQTGINITSGSGNILIGASISASSATASNELNIGNLIRGNTSSGFVGIGTANPATPLHVIGEVRVQNNAATSGASFAQDSSGGLTVTNTGVVQFATGNVGIGISNPSSKLHVVGDIHTSGTLRIQNTSASSAALLAQDAAGLLTVTNSGVVNFATGNIGVGTANPGYKLHVMGDINASGAVRSNGSSLISDRRFKRDIRPLENALAKILNLRGVRYHWRSNEFPDRNFNEREQVGFIAQDVEEIFPEFVDIGPDGFRSVNYAAMASPLVEATKELAHEVEALKTQAQSRDEELSKLRKENDLLKTYLCAKDPTAPFCH